MGNVRKALLDIPTLISSAIAALITFLTALLAHITTMDTNASLTDIGAIPLTIWIVGALIQFGKDVQANIRHFPRVDDVTPPKT